MVIVPDTLPSLASPDIVVVPKSLPDKAQRLYDLISAVSIAEWLAEAIDLSIANKNCAFYEKIKDKKSRNSFKNDEQLYIRIPIGNTCLNFNKMLIIMLKLLCYFARFYMSKTMSGHTFLYNES